MSATQCSLEHLSQVKCKTAANLKHMFKTDTKHRRKEGMKSLSSLSLAKPTRIKIDAAVFSATNRENHIKFDP